MQTRQEVWVWSPGQEEPLEKEMATTVEASILATLVFLPGKSHGQRSLAGYSPWCCKRIRHDLVTKWQQHKLPSWITCAWWRANFPHLKKKLKYNCFTMLCSFLYNSVNQLYVYRYPLPLEPPSPISPLSSLCYTAASHELSILQVVM